MVDLRPGSPVDEIAERLSKVFGIVSLSPAWACPADLDRIQEALHELIPESGYETFKIHSRRADKKFPLPSPEINRILGDHVRKLTGKKVRLDDPDLTIYVHMIDRTAYLYTQRRRGAGGLPVGSSGKIVAFLSGGIDSPVAAYKVLSRGCRVVFVHFHSFPHTSLESQEKVRALVRHLTPYQFRSRLYLVPFAAAQRMVVAYCPPELRVVLYRRLMLRIAEQLARRERAKALVTGESIGQVASQTVENIGAIAGASTLPILRPLIGDDKEEIVSLAERIGTYPISILPDDDCCSLFVPKHPETRATVKNIEASEACLDMDAILREARAEATLEKFEFEPIKDLAAITSK